MHTYRIHMIRHGRTAANDDGRYIGSTDLPLCDEGKKELEAFKNSGLYPDIDALYISPMRRCIQTAGIIYPDMTPTPVKNLRECNFGRFENKTANELKDDEIFRRWLSGEQGIVPEGGESTPDFIMRSVAAFAAGVEDLMREGIRHSGIIAHGGTIMSVLSVCGLPERPFSDWMCGSGRGYTLLVTPSIWMRGYKLEVIGRI